MNLSKGVERKRDSRHLFVHRMFALRTVPLLMFALFAEFRRLLARLVATVLLVIAILLLVFLLLAFFLVVLFAGALFVVIPFLGLLVLVPNFITL